jgi:hypothetical protein
LRRHKINLFWYPPFAESLSGIDLSKHPRCCFKTLISDAKKRRHNMETIIAVLFVGKRARTTRHKQIHLSAGNH